MLYYMYAPQSVHSKPMQLPMEKNKVYKLFLNLVFDFATGLLRSVPQPDR